MLVDLKVKNFILFDDLEINFKNGLNVLTGETGAGKSIIIGALDMLLGSRASTDVIRDEDRITYIEAVYEPEQLEKINQILKEAGIEPDKEILLLSREIKTEGRNRSRINGQMATLSMIRKISRYLVDIHGQHEHQSLLNSGEHLNLLDEFIGEKVKNKLMILKEKYEKIKDIKNKLSGLDIDEAELARELDMLNFQIKEIEEAGLKTGELDKLKKEYKILSNMEEIHSVSGMIASELNGEDFNRENIIDRIGQLMKELKDIKSYDSQLNDFFKHLKDTFYQLQDLSFEFQNYHQELEYNEERLEEIKDRLDLIQTLQKKYGDSITEILEYKDNLIDKRKELESREEIKEELIGKKEKLKKEYNELAIQLSNIRQEHAKKLEELIKEELKDLALKETIFKVDFKEKEPGPRGLDKVEFLISTNPGEELKPLTKIVSGGELSRIMLALKTIIADIDKVDTLIFDEVDSGVGGKTAQMMAEKLALIGRKRQVICITHLPQIASMADTHYFINKKTKNNRTYTMIRELNYEQQKEELARMLGGVKTTETTYQHAEEMLKMAESKK